MKRGLIALFFAPMFLFSAAPLAANAKSEEWRGGSVVTGAVPIGEGLLLEQQSITLHIGSLPGEASYDAYVRSEYVLSNPSEEEKSLHVLFPCGTAPQYEHGNFGAECCELTADGERVEASLRHTFVGYYNPSLNVENVLMQCEGERTDDFYFPDLAVHEHIYTFDLPEEALGDSGRRYLTFVLTFDCDPIRTRIMASRRMYTEIVDGRMRASFDVEAGKNEIILAVAGEDVKGMDYGVFSDRGSSEEVQAGTIAETDKQCTFGEYAMRTYPEETAISPEDWCCGFITMLTRSTSGAIVYAVPDSLREEAFMPWYEYSLTLPAHGTLVHAVKEPIYPALGEGKFVYVYLLSPLRRWGSGKVEVTLETPYYLAHSTLHFKEDGGVYTLQRGSFPLGELVVTLTESERTYLELAAPKPAPIPAPLLGAYIVLGILGTAAVGAAIWGIVVLARRKK